MGTWPSLCFYTFSTPINLLEIAAGMAKRKKTDEEEGNEWLVLGRAQLLRGGAHVVKRKRGQKKCMQEMKPLEEGHCVQTLQVEKEKINQEEVMSD